LTASGRFRGEIPADLLAKDEAWVDPP